MKTESMIAKFSGICPLCSRFIVKSRSHISPLPVPMVPRGDGITSADDRRPYYFDGRSIDIHPRKFAHTRCVRRLARTKTEADPLEKVLF